MATIVGLETTMGLITLELYTSHAPKTCLNFTTLVARNYYTAMPIHRIIPDFLVQTGDPSGTGRGGTSMWAAPFADEMAAELRHSGAGVVSMANSGPDTNGSQFFITLAPTPWLDGKHAIFGRVRTGLRVLERMGRVPTGPGDRPLGDVRIVKAWLMEEAE